jgi:phosphohistidine phosphatase
MWLYLVHHGDALSPDADPRRPLSTPGHLASERLAEIAATRGARPAVIWHSGKLRARQTAELFWRACNPLAEFQAVSGLQPADFPGLFRTQLIGEPRDVMAVGHMPSLPRVLGLLTTGSPDAPANFPAHGIVALERDRDDAESLWVERWRLDPPFQLHEQRPSV